MRLRAPERESAATRQQVPPREPVDTPPAPQQILALQRAVGNGAVVRMLQRAAPAPPAAPAVSAPPSGALGGAEVRIPKAIQEAGVPTTPMDPELAARARTFRVEKNLLTPESFRLNVAVIKYERDGRVHYEVSANDPAELHSESVALRNIESGDPSWTRTRILQVYSERQPCPQCARDLSGVRRRVKVDFPVYYSVGQWQPKRTRARELMARYFPSIVSKPKPAPTAPPQPDQPPKAKQPVTQPEATPTAPVPKVKARTATPEPTPNVPVPKVKAADMTPKIATPRVSRPPMRIRARAVAGGLFGALLAILMSKVLQETTNDFIDWQVQRLQPQVMKRLEEELPKGLALRDELAGQPVYANITFHVLQDSSIDPDLHERIYGAPAVILEDVQYSRRKLDGETGSGTDYDWFVMWEWTNFTYSIALADLLEPAVPLTP